MSLIIPFEEELYPKEGAFIKPSGEIIFTYGKHERFASNFCNGNDYTFLSEVKYGSSWSYYASYFEEFKREYNFDGEREDIDVYKTTMLSKEQLELYKLWLENYEFARRNLYSDFMVYLLNFDKVETVMSRAITTTSSQPHLRFYNYYLMDWYIDCQPPMYFNENNGKFEYSSTDDWYLKYAEDRQIEIEINKIKSKVLVKDRHLFFK